MPYNRLIPETKMPQRSDEWHMWRNSLSGTATQAAIIMGEPPPIRKERNKDGEVVNPTQTWDDLRRDAAFGGPRFQGNDATKHGEEHEPDALALFNEGVDVPFEPICVERRIMSVESMMVGASLDGYRWNAAMERHEWVEIKCPISGVRGDTWKKAAKGEIPRHYYWQMVHQAMSIFDDHNGVGYFYVYVPGEQPLCVELTHEAIYADLGYLEAGWYEFLLGGTQPGDMTQDIEFRQMEAVYIQAKNQSNATGKQATDMRSKMLKRFEEVHKHRNAEPRRIMGDRVDIDRRQSVSIDWEKYHADHRHIDFTDFMVQTVDWEAYHAANPDVDVKPYTNTSFSWVMRIKD